MGITFEFYKEQNYFISNWSGKITDREMLDEHARFFSSDDWVPGMNALASIAEADVSSLSPNGISDLNLYVAQIYRDHNVDKIKSAIYCPDALPYAVAYVYKSLAKDSSEEVRVFLDFDVRQKSG